jgi:hypothetical protein
LQLIQFAGVQFAIAKNVKLADTPDFVRRYPKVTP